MRAAAAPAFELRCTEGSQRIPTLLQGQGPPPPRRGPAAAAAGWGTGEWRSTRSRVFPLSRQTKETQGS